MTYGRLKGLKPEDFQHPGEKNAMAVLRNIPMLDMIAGKYVDMRVQLGIYAETVGSDFRITEKTNPRIYRLYQLALERLDMPMEYPLYSRMSFDYNAGAVGGENPFIYIHSSTIANYTDAEMLNLLGHELGHIKCGHVKYYYLPSLLADELAQMGGAASAAGVGLQYAIMDWRRKAEYSADRAGMIAAGSLEGALAGNMNLLGKSDRIPDISFDVDEVLKQAEDFDIETSDVIGKLLYVSYTARATHPWTILRLKQLKDWYDSGEYDAMINNVINRQ